MAYDTPSLFESIDQDITNQRVASRRALALADTRVANKMGVFLRGARSEEEFYERLGLLEDDFNWTIEAAAEEIGYDHPEYLKEAIIASYRLSASACPICGKGQIVPSASGNSDFRCTNCGKHFTKDGDPIQSANYDDVKLAACPNCGKPGGCDHPEGEHHHADKVEFEESPVEEDENEDPKVASQKRSNDFLDSNNPTVPNTMNQQPQGVQPSISPMVTPYTGPAVNSPEANPAAMQDPQSAFAQGAPGQDPNQAEHMLDPTVPHPQYMGATNVNCEMCENRVPKNSTSVVDGLRLCPECRGSDTSDENQTSELEQQAKNNSKYTGSWKVVANPNPGMQQWRDDFQKNPEAYSQGINNPDGIPHVSPDPMQQPQSPTDFNQIYQHFIDQGVDPIIAEHLTGQYLQQTSRQPTASWKVVGESESGNTDLGGPEPKIDKAKQTGDNPPKYEEDPLDGDGRWPTKHKDITKPIKAENREVDGKPNHELEEIGEKTTETVDLPAAKGDDAGFASGGVDKAPHTKTWHTDHGQTDPVTKSTQK